MDKKCCIIDIEVYNTSDKQGHLLIGLLPLYGDEALIYDNPSREKVKEILETHNFISFNGYRYDFIVLEDYIEGKSVLASNNKIIKGGNVYLENKLGKYTHKYWMKKAYRSYDLAESQFVTTGSIGMSLKNKYIKKFKHDIWEGEKGDKKQFEEVDYIYKNKDKCIQYLNRDLYATKRLFKHHDRNSYLNIAKIVNPTLSKHVLQWLLFNKKITLIVRSLLKGDKNPFCRASNVVTYKSDNDSRNYNPPFISYQKDCISTSTETDGGIHNAIQNKLFKSDGDGKIFSLDFTSLYPNILIQGQNKKQFRIFNDDSLWLYKSWLEKATRWKFGTADEKEKRKPLKLLLNSTYGILQYICVNNSIGEKIRKWICKQGRIYCISLVDKFDKDDTMININTDGIFVKTKKDVNLIREEIEKVVGIGLVATELKWFLSKNVNEFCYETIDGQFGLKGIYNYTKIKPNIIDGKKLTEYDIRERKRWIEDFSKNKYENLPKDYALFGFAINDEIDEKWAKGNREAITELHRLGLDLDCIQWTQTVVKRNKDNTKYVRHRSKDWTIDTTKVNAYEKISPYASQNKKMKTFEKFNCISVKGNGKYTIFDVDGPCMLTDKLKKFKDKTLMIKSTNNDEDHFKLIFESNNTIWELRENYKKYDKIVELRPFKFMTVYDVKNIEYKNNGVKIAKLPDDLKFFLDDVHILKKDYKICDEIEEQLIKKGFKYSRHALHAYILTVQPKCHASGKSDHHNKVKKGLILSVKSLGNKLYVNCWCGDEKCKDEFLKEIEYNE